MAAPEIDGVPLSTTAAWADARVYEGTYHVEMFNMDTFVYSNDEGLFVGIGDDIRQLFPHEPHHFLTHTASVEFKIEKDRAIGFTVELQNGTIAEGVRSD